MNVGEFPKLIEPGVKYFLHESLKNCNTNKHQYYNILINLGLLFLFVFILGGILVYKNKTKLTPEELEKKKIFQQKYLLDRVRKFSVERQKEKEEMITNIPKFESSFVQLHKKYYNI
tara:strand:- start:1098 stop:1448 length:351 start_codon:yes stop_codon:yes gene_type:complete